MSEENIELVRFITEEGLNKGNLDFIDDVFAPDYEVHAGGAEAQADQVTGRVPDGRRVLEARLPGLHLRHPGHVRGR
jgi:hypothetical protein